MLFSHPPCIVCATITAMQITASLPTSVEALQRLVLEQQHMIQTLKEHLLLAMRRQFGPRHESVNVDQTGLFAKGDASTVIDVGAEEADEQDTTSVTSKTVSTERRKAVRILKDLPREIRLIDIPDAEKVCGCCCGALHCFGEESSEQLHFVPAMVRIVETRRRKYDCGQCSGELKRAREDIKAPLPKSMASASLLAYLIMSKFADHCPLHRISQRFNRLGIEIGHGLMSEWLVDAAPLLEGVVERMADQVRASGHVFTDDTILPLQNDDPERRRTINARLWVYASGLRRTKPLVVYDFSRGRSHDAPIRFLKDFRGHLQADAFPGYDVLYGRDVQEVGCLAHARRKFVEVTALMKLPGRAHEALAFIRALYRVERQSRHLADDDRRRQRQERSVPILTQFKAWLDEQIHAVLPKSALGNAVVYTLRNWAALCRYTEHGHLEADNNYAERCMRPVALGRKNFLFVGSERGGKAAAIYYSLIESCKLNKVNPQSYMTYLLANARNKNKLLLLPTEYDGSSIAHTG
jgi:transposase